MRVSMQDHSTMVMNAAHSTSYDRRRERRTGWRQLDAGDQCDPMMHKDGDDAERYEQSNSCALHSGGGRYDHDG
jgi:hypothetical protein